MQILQLYRSFLKRPCTGVRVMTVLMFILEGDSWILDFQSKVAQFAHYRRGGPGDLVNWVLGLYVPEPVTVGILILLMEAHHRLLSLDELKLDTRSVLLYELKFGVVNTFRAVGRCRTSATYAG